MLNLQIKLFLIKLLSFKKQMFIIFSCLITFSFQYSSSQNIIYCLDEMDNTIIEEKDSISELNKKKLIAMGLFLGMIMLYWIYLSTSANTGDFPITSVVETSTSNLSNLENIIITQEAETQTIGNFYSLRGDLKNNLITENDWIASNLYTNLEKHCQRIIDDNNFRAEYIEEITEKYSNKKILVDGKNDKFTSFETWITQKMSKTNK